MVLMSLIDADTLSQLEISDEVRLISEADNVRAREWFLSQASLSRVLWIRFDKCLDPAIREQSPDASWLKPRFGLSKTGLW